MTHAEDAAAKPAGGGASVAGLVAILVAIVLGVLLGVFYGPHMWLASGGATAQREKLEDTFDQKEEFAQQAEAEAEKTDDPQEKQELLKRAKTLREHKVKITARMEELEELEEKAQDESGTLSFQFAHFMAELTEFVGDLFLQVLKLLVIPLVVTSMICGITSLGDVRKIGYLGGATIFYYLATMAVAVIIGLTLVQIIQPGIGADDTFSYVTENVKAKQGTSWLDTILDVFRGSKGNPGDGMFPSNIFQAASNTNVLALIVFAIVFGASLTMIGDKGTTAISFFQGANEAVMKMVHMVMCFAPVGIFGLVTWNIVKNGGGDAFFAELSRLSKYVVTVLLGLALHSLFLAGVLALFARRNPLSYIYNIMRALLTALTTASSSATLPITMECVEENNGVSNRSASFVLPLGATINMDGTALYEAVAVVFIAQSVGMPVGMTMMLIIFFTATLAAMGAAGIPEAGLVTMVIVCQAAGVPIAGIGTILAIDWFLDRLRTTVNVYGDAVGASVIDRQVIEREVVRA